MVNCYKCGEKIFLLDMRRDIVGHFICKLCWEKYRDNKYRCWKCSNNIIGKHKEVYDIKTKGQFLFHINCYNENLEETKSFLIKILPKLKPKTLKIIESFFEKNPDIFELNEELHQLLNYIYDTEEYNKKPLYLIYRYDPNEVELFLDLAKWVVSNNKKNREFESEMLGSNAGVNDFKGLPKKSTLQAKALYYALKERGIEAELEVYDGYKHVDLAIMDAKIYIEIDGSQHSTDPDQLNADLNRDYHSHKDGFVTKRYTNEQINKHLDEIADAIAEVVRKRTK
jgi:very-short-patch-repair endonuclease